MKKCMFFLFALMLGLAQMKADTAADIQGLWTLSSLQGGDTTLVQTPEEMTELGSRYTYDFPLFTTTLEIAGANFTYTYYEGASRQSNGTLSLVDADLTLAGAVEECEGCASKILRFGILSVTANEMVLILFDEDLGNSTYAILTFTK